MSNKSPAFQFYPADFLSDSKVILMSNEAVGCYIKLICHGWLEGSIPSNDEEVGEATDVLMDKAWESINPMERCDVFDYLSRVCAEAIDYEYKGSWIKISQSS